MPNEKAMDATLGSTPEISFRRTRISKSGTITEQQIPLSALKKDAMDLAENTHADSLLLTREAAIRITERAITSAIANTFNTFVETEKVSNSSPVSTKHTKHDETLSVIPGNEKKDKVDANDNDKKVPMDSPNVKAETKPKRTKTKAPAATPKSSPELSSEFPHSTEKQPQQPPKKAPQNSDANAKGKTVRKAKSAKTVVPSTSESQKRPEAAPSQNQKPSNAPLKTSSVQNQKPKNSNQNTSKSEGKVAKPAKAKATKPDKPNINKL